MLLSDTDTRETVHFYSLLHDSQEIDSINPINTTFVIFSKIRAHVVFGSTVRIVMRNVTFTALQ